MVSQINITNEEALLYHSKPRPGKISAEPTRAVKSGISSKENFDVDACKRNLSARI